MIGRKASLDFWSHLLCHAMGYLSLYFITRRMGPEALGIFAFGFAFVGLFGFVGDMGFGVAHIKRLTEGGNSAACIGTYAAIKLVLIALMTLTIVAGVLCYRHVIGRQFETPAHETMIFVALGAVALGGLADIVRSTFTARRETAKRTLPQILSVMVEVTLKIIVSVAGLGAIMLGGASLAGAGVLLLLSGWLFRFERIGRPDWSIVKGYVGFALPVMVIVGANAIIQNMDKIMIQGFSSTEAVGQYTAAARIAILITLVEGPVGLLMFPTISMFHGKQDLESIRTLTRKAERYLSLILLPAGVLAVFLRGPITRILLGERFAASAGIFAFLAVAAIVRTITIPYSSQIIGTNRPGMSAVLSLVLLGLNVMLNLVLIPARLGPVQLAGMGGVGAALATALAALIMAALYRMVAARRIQMGFPKTLLRQVLAAAVMAATFPVLRWGTGMQGMLADTVIGSVASGMYLLTLLLLRELDLRDVAYLFGLVSPVAMKSYVLGELQATMPPAAAEGDGGAA